MNSAVLKKKIFADTLIGVAELVSESSWLSVNGQTVFFEERIGES